MPEVVNTSALSFDTDISNESSNAQIEDDRPTAIKVENVSMIFNMASERLNNLKEYFLKLVKHQLFFEELVALDDISFEVKKGDVFGILGTNGSGKSTLLKIIAGVLEPSKGNVEINGTIAPLIELGAGFDMDLSARENIYLNGALLGYSKDFIEDHFDDIVEFAEVEKFLDMPMKNYSSGMVARIAFAIATVMVPEILIVDEVLSVGDFMFQQKCENRINELIEKYGVTVLIVSHSNDQIERLCNKAIWIEKGHTRIMGDATKVCSAYRVLGGRTGSAKSEEIIFDYYKNRSSNITPELDIYKSNIPHDLSKQITCSIWKNDSLNTAVLVPDYTHVFALVISPIAGVLNAPVIPFERDNYISTTFSTLFSLKPSNALIVAHKTRAQDMANDPWFSEIGITATDFSCGKDFSDINPSILKYGIQNDIWNTDIAFVVSASEVLNSLPLAAYSYSNTVPLIILENDNGLLDSQISSLLCEIGIKKLLTLDALYNSSFISDSNMKGFDVEQIHTKLENDTIGLYPEVPKQNKTKHTLFIAFSNTAYWNYLISIPSVAGYSKSPLLIVDDTDLDNIANSLKYATSRSFEKLIALGHSNTLDVNNSFVTLLKRGINSK